MPKLTSYTVKFKLEVVRWYRRNGENERKTAQHFNVGRKSIYRWRREFDTLLAHDNSRDRLRRKLTMGGTPMNIELDNKLFDYFMDERLAGLAVTNGALKLKALQFGEELKISQFTASAGYIRNFKKRFDISMRRGTNECQKKPEELAEVLTTWRLSLRSQRRKHDYLPHEIANMDETMCRFDMPYERTNELKGKKAVRIKNTGQKKKGCTVALCAFASGDKLPAYCIFKEAKGFLGQRVLQALKVPENVVISASRNGWMVANNFKDWCQTVWKETEDPDQRRRLIVLDQYKPHFSTEAKILLEELLTDITLIPGGCTSLIQPADVSWNKPFKSKLRELWTQWMATARQLTKSGKLKSPRRQNVIDWISKAWDCVTPEVIINSFLYTGIATNLDGTQDDLIRNNIEPEDTAEEEEETDTVDNEFEEDTAEIDEIEPFDSSEDEAGPSCSSTQRDDLAAIFNDSTSEEEFGGFDDDVEPFHPDESSEDEP